MAAKAIYLERPPRAGTASLAWSTQDLHRQRIYILPTRYGLVYAVLLFAIFLGAINYNNSMAFMLTFILVGLGTIGILHTYRNMLSLIVNSLPATSVFAGETVYFPVQFNNPSRYMRYAVEIAPARRQAADKIALTPSRINCIAAEETQTIHLQAIAEKRGVFYPARSKIISRFPLGLFHAWSYLDIPHTCVIYPRPVGQLLLPVYIGDSDGKYASRQSGTDDFIGFKNYQPYDPINQVAWKSLAKGRPLLLKKFNGLGESKIALRWEDTASLAEIEERLSQLAMWVVTAEAQGMQYSLQLPDILLPAAAGSGHKHNCLKALAEFHL